MLLHDPELMNLSGFDGVRDRAAAGRGVPTGALRDVHRAPPFDSELVAELRRDRGYVSGTQEHGFRVLRGSENREETAGQCSALARLRSLRRPASAVVMRPGVCRDADAPGAHEDLARGRVEIEQERQRAVEAGEGSSTLNGGELPELDRDTVARAVGAGVLEAGARRAHAVWSGVSHQLSLSSGVGSCR